MPRIRPIESQVNAPGPTQGRQATAEDFGSAIGEGAQRLGTQTLDLGVQLKRNDEMQDISDYSNKHSKYVADKSIAMKEGIRTADVTNPNFDGKKFSHDFLEDYDKGIEELQGGIRTDAGRRFADKINGKMRPEFEKMAYSAQADIMGQKAGYDADAVENNLSNALLVNPGNFQASASIYEDHIKSLIHGENGTPGYMSAEEGMKRISKARTDMAAADIRGWAKLNPDYAKKLLKGDTYNSDLNADKKAHLEGEIDQAIRGKEVEAERKKKRDEEALKKQQITTQNDFLSRMAPDSKKPLAVQDVLDSNLAPFGSGSKEQFIKLMQEDSKKALDYTDPALYKERLRQISLPDGDPNKLTDENVLTQDSIDGKLSTKNRDELRSEIQGRRSEAGKAEGELKDTFLKTVARHDITKSNDMLGIQDNDGDKNYLAFQSWFISTYAQKRKEGISSDKLLTPEYPGHPADKEYLGNFISQFKTTPTQALNKMSEAFQEKAGPVKPPPQPAPQGLLEAGNIDLNNRPQVLDPANGKTATVRSITVGFGKGPDEKYYVLPTVINGQIVSNEAAIDYFKQSRQHLGAFKTQNQADTFAEKLHQSEQDKLNAQEKMRKPGESPQDFLNRMKGP